MILQLLFLVLDCLYFLLELVALDNHMFALSVQHGLNLLNLAFILHALFSLLSLKHANDFSPVLNHLLKVYASLLKLLTLCLSFVNLLLTYVNLAVKGVVLLDLLLNF